MNRYEVGDIVGINEKCTIEQINNSGCKRGTFDFLSYDIYRKSHVYEIEEIGDNYCIIEDYMVDPVCLKLVQKNSEIKKLEEEISKDLGYNIKIVKEQIVEE